MSTHLIPVEIQWLRGGMNETLGQSPATNCTQWSEGVWHCGTQPHDRRCINTVYANHTNKQLCQRHQLVCTEPQWPQQLSESHVTPNTRPNTAAMQQDIASHMQLWTSHLASI